MKVFNIIALLCFCCLYRAEASSPESGDIKIGLLVQDAHSLDAIQGTELAIKMANDKGGCNGRKFQLIIRSMEGTWGTGSKEAVDLIFNEKVYGLIGSHDGRNAHLVEQACAKTHVSFISAKASDPTLSQAFVPWFFSCVPNDLQQSALFIKKVFRKAKFEKVAVVYDNSYDSNTFGKNLLRKLKSEGIKEPLMFSSANAPGELKKLMDRIQKENPQCIILSGHPGFSKEFLEQAEIRKMNQPVYSSLFSINLKNLNKNPNLFLFSSAFFPFSEDFARNFEASMGEKPEEAAAFAYDATNILITAIKKAGCDRDKIQAEIFKIHYAGVTGNISFDERGNRRAWL